MKPLTPPFYWTIEDDWAELGCDDIHQQDDQLLRHAAHTDLLHIPAGWVTEKIRKSSAKYSCLASRQEPEQWTLFSAVPAINFKQVCFLPSSSDKVASNWKVFPPVTDWELLLGGKSGSLQTDDLVN